MKKEIKVVLKGKSVPVSSVIIPDLWHIAMNLKDEQNKKTVIECWHIAHALKESLVEIGYRKDEASKIRCYRIIRQFSNDRKLRVIKNNVTLDEAQAHCRRPDSKGVTWDSDWRDCYDYMPKCAPKKD